MTINEPPRTIQLTNCMDVQFLQEVASGRILRLFTCEINIVRPSTPAHGSATPEHTGEPERQSMPIIAGWRRSSAKTGEYSEEDIVPKRIYEELISFSRI